jgi:hypothetical protein
MATSALLAPHATVDALMVEHKAPVTYNPRDFARGNSAANHAYTLPHERRQPSRPPSCMKRTSRSTASTAHLGRAAAAALPCVCAHTHACNSAARGAWWSSGHIMNAGVCFSSVFI